MSFQRLYRCYSGIFEAVISFLLFVFSKGELKDDEEPATKPCAVENDLLDMKNATHSRNTLLRFRVCVYVWTASLSLDFFFSRSKECRNNIILGGGNQPSFIYSFRTFLSCTVPFPFFLSFTSVSCVDDGFAASQPDSDASVNTYK